MDSSTERGLDRLWGFNFAIYRSANEQYYKHISIIAWNSSTSKRHAQHFLSINLISCSLENCAYLMQSFNEIFGAIFIRYYFKSSLLHYLILTCATDIKMFVSCIWNMVIRIVLHSVRIVWSNLGTIGVPQTEFCTRANGKPL